MGHVIVQSRWTSPLQSPQKVLVVVVTTLRQTEQRLLSRDVGCSSGLSSLLPFLSAARVKPPLQTPGQQGAVCQALGLALARDLALASLGLSLAACSKEQPSPLIQEHFFFHSGQAPRGGAGAAEVGLGPAFLNLSKFPFSSSVSLRWAY